MRQGCSNIIHVVPKAFKHVNHLHVYQLFIDPSNTQYLTHQFDDLA